MKLNSNMVLRIVRGLVGATLIIVGIINENWIGLMGVFLIFGALTGSCGFGSTNCQVPDYKKEDNPQL